MKIYVCNVATQPGETDGYDVARHVAAVVEHLPGQVNPLDVVLATTHFASRTLELDANVTLVTAEPELDPDGTVKPSSRKTCCRAMGRVGRPLAAMTSIARSIGI